MTYSLSWQTVLEAQKTPNVADFWTKYFEMGSLLAIIMLHSTRV
jgi:hypothetical protein